MWGLMNEPSWELFGYSDGTALPCWHHGPFEVDANATRSDAVVSWSIQLRAG